MGINPLLFFNGLAIIMTNNKIELVKAHSSELKKEYKVENTPVKVIGVGPKALNVLVLEASRFCCTPVWKQHWINYKKDVPEKEYAKKLIDEMVKAISQTTL